MDDTELTNLARQWAVQVGVVERAAAGIRYQEEIHERAEKLEVELADKLTAEAVLRGATSITVAGYRVDIDPTTGPDRVKL